MTFNVLDPYDYGYPVHQMWTQVLKYKCKILLSKVLFQLTIIFTTVHKTNIKCFIFDNNKHGKYNPKPHLKTTWLMKPAKVAKVPTLSNHKNEESLV